MTYRPGILLLISGCALFGTIVGGEFSAGVPNDAAASPAPAVPAASSMPRAIPPAHIQQLVAATLARPLFEPRRRPPQSDARADAAPQLGARLTGIVTEPGRKLAIFEVPGDKPLTLGIGEAVTGWRIDRITPRDVSVTGPDGTRTLLPKADPAVAARTFPRPTARAAPAPPVLPHPPLLARTRR